MEWMNDVSTWGWFWIYWTCCYAIVQLWCWKNDERIDSLEIFLITIIASLFLPWLMVASFIGKFIKAGKGPDDDW